MHSHSKHFEVSISQSKKSICVGLAKKSAVLAFSQSLAFTIHHPLLFSLSFILLTSLEIISNDNIKVCQTFHSSGDCRKLRFTIDPIHGQRLEDHVIRTTDVIDEHACRLKCLLEPNCVSYNFNKKEDANGRHKCDLNNATYEHSDDLAKNESYVYREAQVIMKIITEGGWQQFPTVSKT